MRRQLFVQHGQSSSAVRAVLLIAIVLALLLLLLTPRSALGDEHRVDHGARPTHAAATAFEHDGATAR